jgi:hypothetical protein
MKVRVSFTSWPLYHRGKSIRDPLDRMPSGSNNSQSGRGDKENDAFLAGNRLSFVRPSY